MSGSGQNGDDKGKVPKSIEDLLAKFNISSEVKNLSRKEMEDYKFWKTQPVPSLDQKIDKEGPIDKPKKPEDISEEPLPLLKDFEWSTLDLSNPEELDELYQLLYDNYAEDEDATFRFKYSHEFFKWALMAPGWRKEWHVGVRVSSNKKLVGFISGTPVTLGLNHSHTTMKSVEINFLCVHKKLRTKRLAPVLIKEVTRRVNRHDVWQALYTVGQVLPSPISTCRYTHCPLNWSKLYDVGFSHLPPNKTKASMESYYAIPNEITIDGLRLMNKNDVDQVFDLLIKFQERFDLVQVFSKAELAHWLLGGLDDSSKSNVIKTFVVQNKDGKITDFFSYYLLPFTVLNHPVHKELSIAYLFYYASDTIIENPSQLEPYKERLEDLIHNALITAKDLKVDVFNCLTSQDNAYFIKKCKFGSGDGFLNFYLFNYKTWNIHGGIDHNTKEVTENDPSGIGVVLL